MNEPLNLDGDDVNMNGRDWTKYEDPAFAHHRNGQQALVQGKDAKAKPGCCKQGGCCSNTPMREMYDAEGNIIRINMSVASCRCCGCFHTGMVVSGLDPSDYEHLPIEIEGKTRLTLTDWQIGIEQLATIQAQTQCTLGNCFKDCSMILCTFLIFPIPWICKNMTARTMARDAQLREWQDSLNKTLLPHHLFIKTRSYCFITYDDNGRQRHVSKWLALATTEAEIAALQAEPHLTGTIDNTESCGGVNENTLCWHYG